MGLSITEMLCSIIFNDEYEYKEDYKKIHFSDHTIVDFIIKRIDFKNF